MCINFLRKGKEEKPSTDKSNLFYIPIIESSREEGITYFENVNIAKVPRIDEATYKKVLLVIKPNESIKAYTSRVLDILSLKYDNEKDEFSVNMRTGYISVLKNENGENAYLDVSQDLSSDFLNKLSKLHWEQEYIDTEITETYTRENYIFASSVNISGYDTEDNMFYGDCAASTNVLKNYNFIQNDGELASGTMANYSGQEILNSNKSKLSLVNSNFIIGLNKTGYYNTSSKVLVPQANVADTIGLTSENIKKDVNILGIIGTLEGITIKELDVNFYDYNGELLYAYTTDDFLGLSALPEEPVHESLVNVGWTYTLEEAKDFVTNCKKLDIGMQYKTENGHTRIFIDLLPNNLSPTLQLDVNSNVRINWGDGNEELFEYSSEEAGSYIALSLTHEYSAAGEYIIQVTPEDNGKIVMSSKLFYESNHQYTNCIKEIWLGENVTVSKTNVLSNLGSLKYILISYGITELTAFSNTYLLECLIMPNSIETINAKFNYDIRLKLILVSRNLTSSFDTMFSTGSIMLKHLILDTKVTSFSNVTFSSTPQYSLDYLIFSDNVTSISNFKSLTQLRYIHIPKNIVSISNMTFTEVLEEVEISNPNLGEDETLTISSSFTNCYKLHYVKMTNVTSITNSFTNGDNLKVVDFSETTRIPIISGVGFSHATIIVPDELYDEWIATECWSSFVDNIVKASEYEN